MIFIRRYPGYKYVLAALDWITVIAAFLLAYSIRGRVLVGDLFAPGSSLVAEIAFIVIYSAVALPVFQYFNLYKVNLFTTVSDHIVQLFRGVVVLVVGLALLSYFTRATWIVDSRLATIYFLIVATVLLIILRVGVFRTVFLWSSRKKIFKRNVLIVGANATGRNLAATLTLNSQGGHHVVGFLDDELPLGKNVFEGEKVLGRLAELGDCVSVFDIQEIIICLEKSDYTRLMNVVEIATQTRKTVKIASPLYEVVPSRLFIEQYGDIPVVGVAQTSPTPIRQIYKRATDIVIASVGLMLLSPVLLLIALLVTLDSPGPVFFRQIRIGKNGRPFLFYKFRSMVVGSDRDEKRVDHVREFIKSKTKVTSSENGATKIVDQSKVTRVGQWLRRTSVDELPQLFNVLKGDMSLVGPRPCLPYEWEHYEDWHKRRLSVLPGCTGLWQVSGRSAVGFDDMVVLDLYYIQNSSFWLDLQLMVKTIPVMVLGTGAK